MFCMRFHLKVDSEFTSLAPERNLKFVGFVLDVDFD